MAKRNASRGKTIRRTVAPLVKSRTAVKVMPVRMARVFQCPDDCKTLSVVTRPAVPSWLIVRM
jgi:hypothetical protein